jgi:putative transposase
VVADRWYPSSKTCSACGAVKATLRLSERTYRCDQCGLVADRDPGAARNLASLVDEVGGRHVLPKLAWATVNEPEANPHQTRTTRAAGTATVGGLAQALTSWLDGTLTVDEAGLVELVH